MTSMIHHLNTLHRNQAILCDYRARNVTHWSEQEQYENQQRYKYRMRKNNFFENELDEEINNQIRMGLNDKNQCEIMQKVSFTNELLNQLRHFTTDKIPTHEYFNELKIHHVQQIFCSVKTVKYNESKPKESLDKHVKKKMNKINMMLILCHLPTRL